MRFFSDHCVPREISEFLSRHGHEVFLLSDQLPIRSPDTKVIGRAQELNSVLLSLNGDFTDIVTYPPSRYKGIVAIQLHNHPEIIPQLMTRFCRFLDEHPETSFYRGKLFLVEAHRVRIRS